MDTRNDAKPPLILKLQFRDWDAEKKKWGWARAPPVSQKSGGEPDTPKKLRKKVLVSLQTWLSRLVIQCQTHKSLLLLQACLAKQQSTPQAC